LSPLRPFQSRHPRYTGENLEKNKVLYARLEMMSNKYGCTPDMVHVSPGFCMKGRMWYPPLVICLDIVP
jgi:hypothetical protein